MKFLSKPFEKLLMPRLIKDSYIVSREWLALFGLSFEDFN
jgi:hypothetical protein